MTDTDNLADIKRNGYPCSYRDFGWLVAEVARLQAESDHWRTLAMTFVDVPGLTAEEFRAKYIDAVSPTPTDD